MTSQLNFNILTPEIMKGRGGQATRVKACRACQRLRQKVSRVYSVLFDDCNRCGQCVRPETDPTAACRNCIKKNQVCEVSPTSRPFNLRIATDIVDRKAILQIGPL